MSIEITLLELAPAAAGFLAAFISDRFLKKKASKLAAQLANAGASIPKESWIFRAVLFMFVLVVVTYASYFFLQTRWQISNSASDWAQAGDFINGVMSPIISLAVLYFVFQAYMLQREELKTMAREVAHATQAQQEQARMAVLQAQIDAERARFDRTLSEYKSALAEHREAIVSDKEIFDLGGHKGRVSRTEYLPQLLEFVQAACTDVNKSEQKLHDLAEEAAKIPDRQN